MVETEFTKDTLRDRLIIAGAEEIGQHGIADFSLRRVASACNTSCAAPYKHFKNKEEFIYEIICYINRQWELLRDQIFSLFEGDARTQLVEVCVGYIRFWVANPNYRSILRVSETSLDDKQANERAKNAADLDSLIEDYYRSYSKSEWEISCKIYALKALLYGMTMMLENEELPSGDRSFELIRALIEREIDGNFV